MESNTLHDTRKTKRFSTLPISPHRSIHKTDSLFRNGVSPPLSIHSPLPSESKLNLYSASGDIRLAIRGHTLRLAFKSPGVSATAPFHPSIDINYLGLDAKNANAKGNSSSFFFSSSSSLFHVQSEAALRIELRWLRASNFTIPRPFPARVEARFPAAFTGLICARGTRA